MIYIDEVDFYRIIRLFISTCVYILDFFFGGKRGERGECSDVVRGIVRGGVKGVLGFKGGRVLGD